MSGDHYWLVAVDGLEQCLVIAPTGDTAKYAAWRAMSEAGYYTGRDGFWRFLAAGGRAWPASEYAVREWQDAGRGSPVRHAPTDPGRRATDLVAMLTLFGDPVTRGWSANHAGQRLGMSRAGASQFFQRCRRRGWVEHRGAWTLTEIGWLVMDRGAA